jgi:2-polyprenyl-6-methoxyphenol hydroxylase-like FAD-dependent oxidoreductase
MSLTVRIAGQGICGTLLSWFLAQHDIDVSVYDAGIDTSATMAASGIINPITGKRLVKTWMADELIPAAVQAYTDIGAALGQIIYSARHMRPMTGVLVPPTPPITLICPMSNLLC